MHDNTRQGKARPEKTKQEKSKDKTKVKVKGKACPDRGRRGGGDKSSFAKTRNEGQVGIPEP